MIIVTVTFTVAVGKMREAKDLALKMSKFINKKTPKKDHMTVTPLCGDQNKIMHIAKATSVEEWDADRKARQNDPEFQELMKDAPRDIITGMERTIYLVEE